MSEQLRIVDEPPALTERQEYVLERITAAGADGLFSDEIGAVLHARKHLSMMAGRLYNHAADDRCEYCGRDGRGVALELKAKGRVVQRGASRFVAVDLPEQEPTPEPARAEDEPAPYERIYARPDGTRGVIPFRPTIACATRPPRTKGVPHVRNAA